MYQKFGTIFSVEVPMRRLHEIFCKSDISLAAFMVGLALAIWGLTALLIQPQDLTAFANHMSNASLIKSIHGYVWGLAYVTVGLGFMHQAYRNFQPVPSLLVGSAAVIIWFWILTVRSITLTNFTNGITLNVLVIIMGALLIQRSTTK